MKQNAEINIKEIRNTLLKGITCQFLPFYLIGLIIPKIKNIPGSEAIGFLIIIFASVIFCCGYGLCAEATDRYATYKGYGNPLYIFSIFNIFGLSILFLLKNKNKVNSNNKDQDPLERFSITAIFASYLVIPLIVIMPISILLMFFIETESIQTYYQNNKNFSTFSELAAALTLAWYFFKQLKIVNIDFNRILGSLKSINFKLPLGLAIIKYLFAWGINSITLYSLSFIVPKYVESQLNYVYASTLVSWTFFAISALIYAPIMEELFFRGIIFQKIAIKQSFWRGLLISAILFAAIHFRYDIISLFVTGIITALLYFKTKQLATSIIYHFGYNLIVIVRKLYSQIFSNTDPSIPTSIVEYQQNFLHNFELYILFLAISSSYLSYFIYKNFPQKTNIRQLPYFVNQEISN